MTTSPARPPRLVLLLPIVLLSASCATRSPPRLVTPEIPPPPAALMSAEPSASWLDWSQMVRDYLQRARSAALGLRPRPPGCATTSPESANRL